MTLDQWLEPWTRKSTEVQTRVKTALDFLRKHYGNNDAKILSEIKCIDFSRPVGLPNLLRGMKLTGSKDPRNSPYRAVYFTRSGHPAERLGIATEGNLHSNPKIMAKVLNRYEVIVLVPQGEVLESICAPASDHWSVKGRTVLASGGGVQYLIPNMNRYLRFIEDSGKSAYAG